MLVPRLMQHGRLLESTVGNRHIISLRHQLTRHEDRALAIPEEDAAKSGITPSHVRINPKYGGGYPANLEGLHQLHCLVSRSSMTPSVLEHVILTCFIELGAYVTVVEFRLLQGQGPRCLLERNVHSQTTCDALLGHCTPTAHVYSRYWSIGPNLVGRYREPGWVCRLQHQPPMQKLRGYPSMGGGKTTAARRRVPRGLLATTTRTGGYIASNPIDNRMRGQLHETKSMVILYPCIGLEPAV